MTGRFGLVGLLAMLALMPAAAGAAPLASALGPKMPMATPSDAGFVGTLAATPDHGPLGTLVAVTGKGFPAEQKLQLVWRTVRGSWNDSDGNYRGRTYKPVGYRIAVVTTDAKGRFTAHFTVPEDFGFLHDLVVQQGDRLLTQTGFYLNMQLKVSPKRVTLGEPVTIDVKGIGWRDLENSWMLVYDNGFTGWVSAVTTSGSAHFTIPATGAVGTHVVRLVHGAFTFPYLNPEQNPYPTRPRFRTTFQLVKGKAVLPPPPEAQVQKRVRDLPKPGELIPSPRFSGIRMPVSVTAHRLSPHQRYRLLWSTIVGNRVAAQRDMGMKVHRSHGKTTVVDTHKTAQGWLMQTRSVAEATSDADGNAVFSFKVPDDLGGAHRISLKDGATTQTGTYWITPTALPLDVDHGPAGTTFTVHLKGVGWTDTANIYTVDYDNSYFGYACGFNSQGDVTIHLPASGVPSWHFVDLYPGIYKGKEKRPRNFQIPQLTYAADHPGEDLPAFHFAFKVTQPRKQAGMRASTQAKE